MTAEPWSLEEDGPQQIITLPNGRQLYFPTSDRVELMELVAAHNKTPEQAYSYYESSERESRFCGDNRCIFRNHETYPRRCLICKHPEK